MKAPRRAALAPARPVPRHARELGMTPHAAPERTVGPLIRITVTVELPGRLTVLLTAAAALTHLLRRGWLGW
jgi:hypothetical protein